MSSRKRISVALVGLIALVVIGWFVRDYTGAGDEQVPGAADSGLQVSPMSALPPEVRATWKSIADGAPFRYPGRDGTVFSNREERLPERPSGYYHEYTVPTPGSPDRGARRLITGERSEIYYTGDHYESFVVVDPDG
ncbi:ribonuclease N [Saccharopolyspora erythraea]|uniref:ribonuclease domain-containing protein n=1 Tax=Saccharopolyspora erythraea TaxID=1836 RepID=UPI001BA837E5|nr:ribonuclease domain-containing protein [Saccharopolyspora erythraea]QUH01051.1 ribonuclease N [Saccharopolyspora erythraea]